MFFVVVIFVIECVAIDQKSSSDRDGSIASARLVVTIYALLLTNILGLRSRQNCYS